MDRSEADRLSREWFNGSPELSSDLGFEIFDRTQFDFDGWEIKCRIFSRISKQMVVYRLAIIDGVVESGAPLIYIPAAICECGCIVEGFTPPDHCPVCGVPIVSGLSDEDVLILRGLIVLAVKEIGEIAECVVKGDPTAHWRDELGDLCGLVVKPMLELARIRYADACKVGIARKKEKTTK